jgi:REP element-mobilizing transposase RayT
MPIELIRSAHTVGESNLHLQFTPAYRRNIFSRPLVRELTIAYLLERARQLKVFISAIDCGPDHIHLFVENWKNWSISDLARELKSYASRKMRQGHNYLKICYGERSSGVLAIFIGRLGL